MLPRLREQAAGLRQRYLENLRRVLDREAFQRRQEQHLTLVWLQRLELGFDRSLRAGGQIDDRAHVAARCGAGRPDLMEEAVQLQPDVAFDRYPVRLLEEHLQADANIAVAALLGTREGPSIPAQVRQPLGNFAS